MSKVPVTVKKVELPEDRRILVISDIHGNLEYLKGVLEKAGFGKEDILIVVGDALEKGPESLNTLRYLMQLSKTHSLYQVCGNCDYLFKDIENTDPDNDREALEYMMLRKNSILKDMCREAGIEIAKDMDVPLMKKRLLEEFREEWDYLRSLPIILDTQKFIFVHAGLQSEDLDQQDGFRCFKNNAFMDQGLCFSKYCVVGHWPVSLYHKDRMEHNPLIDRERRCISIDGGCVLKDDGQLNALVIPHVHSEDFSWFYYDNLEKAVALEDQEASDTETIHIPWVDNQVRVLEKGEEFSYCEHVPTGYRLWILNDLMFEKNGKVYTDDCTDYQLGVRAGDEVGVVYRTGEGWLVKKDGCAGWYHKTLAFKKV